jgi:hypothetical protein
MSNANYSAYTDLQAGDIVMSRNGKKLAVIDSARMDIRVYMKDSGEGIEYGNKYSARQITNFFPVKLGIKIDMSKLDSGFSSITLAYELVKEQKLQAKAMLKAIAEMEVAIDPAILAAVKAAK